jgi:hypothetical protein
MGDLNPGKLAAVPSGKAMISILPTTFEEVVRFAQLAVKAGLFKAQQKRWRQPSEDGEDDNDGKQTDEKAYEMAQAQATMIILHGLELSISPMQAFEGITIINGKKRVYGDLLAGLLRSNGCKLREWQEGTPYEDNFTAHCEITRPNSEVITYSYSVSDAKTAKLWQLDKPKVQGWEWYYDVAARKRNKRWGQLDNDATWFKHPKRMLIHRCRGFCAMDGASDFLRGLYPAECIDEENRSHDIRDVTPRNADISIVIPAAPPTTSAQKQIEAPREEPIEAAPQETGDILDELRLALTGAKTANEAYDAWDELSECICLAGQQVRQQGEALLEERLEQLPKQIDEENIADAARRIDMLAGVPSVKGGVA